MKKNLFKLVILITFSVITIACKKSNDETKAKEWTRVSDFEGLPRSGAVGFTIGNYSYVTTGYSISSKRFKDTWQFDATTSSWTEKAQFPGEARNNAVAFSVKGKGYVGLGTNGDSMFNDFYEYDPIQNTWTKIPDFPDTGRWGSVAFAIGDKGYVGTGRDKDLQDYNDFHQYDPANKNWKKVTSTPGKRSFSFTFVLDGVAYLGGGINNNALVTSLYAFNGEKWTEKKALTGRTDYNYDLTRTGAMTFVLGGNAYLSGGLNNTTIGSTWRYVPSSDYWIEHDSFEGSNRHQGVGFVLGNKGYITTGRSGTAPFDDTWAFNPNL